MLRILALVAVGGALGAVARAVIEDTWPHDTATIGWATVAINTSGCLLIGMLLGGIDRWRPEQELLRPFLGVGVLGGYTTFSTHVVEVVALAGAGRPAAAVAVLALQFGTALLAVVVGSHLVTRGADR